MKQIFIIIILLFCFVIHGCTTTTPSPDALLIEDMTDFHVQDLKSADVYDLQFSDYKIQVSTYQNALITMLEKNKSLSSSGNNKLEVYLLSAGAPVIVPIPFNPYESSTLSVWKFDGRIYISRSEYRANVGDGFMGGKRMRSAVEGALRNSIKDGLDMISSDSQSRSTKCNNSLIVIDPIDDKVREVVITNIDTKTNYHMFPTNKLFLHSVPPGNYELARTNSQSLFIPWDVDHVKHTLHFKVEPSKLYVLDNEFLESDNAKLKALLESFKKIDSSLVLQKITLPSQ